MILDLSNLLKTEINKKLKRNGKIIINLQTIKESKKINECFINISMIFTLLCFLSYTVYSQDKNSFDPKKL